MLAALQSKERLPKMASTEERPGMHEIDLMSLAIPQLNQLKNQLDQVILSLITNTIKY